MHDLNTLNRLNAEAHAKGIHTARCAGQWVVARFEGLTLIGYTAHDAEPVTPSASTTGENFKLFPPLGDAHAALARGRDQSEDLAA